ncbi:MAG: hypothetical protein CSA51_03045 [Gammaproteobacteria bacterium]|nr:MAG: hypothetical protein CSA51_03045 [Gammaproteobacteria bacterium]
MRGDKNQIEIPFWFVLDVISHLEKVHYDETGLSIGEASSDILMHTIFHELAHAFIAMYGIPILGKEEDAADTLATILLIEYFSDGQDIALTAADFFAIESENREGGLQDEDFGGEHSLDEQRHYSTLCYIYGSSPKEYAFLVEEGRLPKERSETCIDEYEEKVQNWSKLLEPYIKPIK